MLQEELLKEIGHLEEKKEEAVKAAATCSVEHFQSLQDQFFSESHLIQPSEASTGCATQTCYDGLVGSGSAVDS